MNYVLDTCAVSELRVPARANAGLVKWAEKTPGDIYIAAITLVELEIGVMRIERRDARQGEILRRWLDDEIAVAFRGRILPFDEDAARLCARLHVPDPRPERDAMIAATAIGHRHALVTRNVKDFRGMKGLTLINPWTASSKRTSDR